ncbi:MAG: hypothetical protein EAZ43_11720 [Betaproteobacteria bacterium]|nr:MAG: hypothetical protein EAZ43_11720 [Betaproteobacteria bacterium]
MAAQAAFEETDPVLWTATLTSGAWTVAPVVASASNPAQALQTACFFAGGKIQDSVNQYYERIAGQSNLYTCWVEIRDDRGVVTWVAFSGGVTATCPNGYSYSDATPDNDYTTGKCKRPSCAPSVTLTCHIKSGAPISSVPAARCDGACVWTQQIGPQEERFEAGVQSFFYEFTKIRTAARCYVAGSAGGAVSCNSGPPTPQEPCQLPAASENPQCGGGTGCPSGTAKNNAGACMPDADGDGAPDGDGGCPSGTYKPGGVGACIPFPGGSEDGDDGDNGDGGNGGATGGGNGTGNGSATGTKCGDTGNLCQTKFQEYLEFIKDYFKGDAGEEAAAKAEIAKSRAGGYEENRLNKGALIDLGALQLNVSGFWGGGCPSPRNVSILGGSITLEYTAICDFAQLIAPLLLSICGLVCARIVFGAF